MFDRGLCDGAGDENGEHCCSLQGADCPHLVIDGPTGRHFACGLYTELGDWDLVHTDTRYLADVRPLLTAGTADCGEWFGAPASEMTGNMSRGKFAERAQCCFKRLHAADPAKRATAVSIINRRR